MFTPFPLVILFGYLFHRPFASPPSPNSATSKLLPFIGSTGLTGELNSFMQGLSRSHETTQYGDCRGPLRSSALPIRSSTDQVRIILFCGLCSLLILESSKPVVFLVFSAFAVTSIFTVQGECVSISGSPSSLASPVSIMEPHSADAVAFQRSAESLFVSRLPFTGCTLAPTSLAAAVLYSSNTTLPAFPAKSMLDPTAEYKPKG